MSTRSAVLQAVMPVWRRDSHASVCLQDWHQKCAHYFILTASTGALMLEALLDPAAGTKLRPSPLSSEGQPSSSHLQLLSSVPSCKAQPVPICVEGLGMASSCLTGGHILLTGGASRAGRGAETRVLLRGREGWSVVRAEQSADPGETPRVTEQTVGAANAEALCSDGRWAAPPLGHAPSRRSRAPVRGAVLAAASGCRRAQSLLPARQPSSDGAADLCGRSAPAQVEACGSGGQTQRWPVLRRFFFPFASCPPAVLLATLSSVFESCCVL